MSQVKSKIQNLIIIIIDTICLIIGYYMSGMLWLMMWKNMNPQYAAMSLDSNIIFILAAILFASLMYMDNHNFTERGKLEELKLVIKKNIVIAGTVAVCVLLKRSDDLFPRGVYVLTILISVILSVFFRYTAKAYLVRFRRFSKTTSKMVMITTKSRAKYSIERLRNEKNWISNLCGIIITDEDMIGQEILGIPVVSGIHKALLYIKNEVVDEVYIDEPTMGREAVRHMILKLEDMGVTTHLNLLQLEKMQDFDTSLQYLGDVPVITFANRFYDVKDLLIKRVFDILGSIIGILLMLIAMIFVVPAIKLESKGPVFFKQLRVGKNGRYFNVYKFRSMYVDAEERKAELMAQNEMSGLMFKITDDPRITRVGRFIRKTSIDELPQFINVLFGDMSLVGTRPPTVNEFKQYEDHHKRRLSMKPGITGMWQAYGRNTVHNFEDIVKMDLDYIDHFSLTLDVKILVRTVVAVFQGQ